MLARLCHRAKGHPDAELEKKVFWSQWCVFVSRRIERSCIVYILMSTYTTNSILGYSLLLDEGSRLISSDSEKWLMGQSKPQQFFKSFCFETKKIISVLCHNVTVCLRYHLRSVVVMETGVDGSLQPFSTIGTQVPMTVVRLNHLLAYLLEYRYRNSIW